MNPFPKILIGGPTASAKKYCDQAWIDNVMQTEYPNYVVRLWDNTQDNGEYCESLNEYYRNKYGDDAKFECIKTDTFGLPNSILARVCKSHNEFREYAIDNGFDYGLHLESDIFPKPHFLQELLLMNKQVAGALYYRDEGRFRRLLVQKRIQRAPTNIFNANFDIYDDLHFIDGTIKQVAHIGLGCILIRRDVLEKIKFRYIPGVEVFPDSYAAEDLYKLKIPIYAHSALIAEHRNANWMLQVYTKDNKF